ncbi:MAG: transposase [bacterium]
MVGVAHLFFNVPHIKDYMKFTAGHLFHIYNRGNNKQEIFFKEENYFFFLRKVRKYIYPYCDILSYCLMQNHFHFLIHANSLTVSKNTKDKNLLSEGFKQLLSSYSKAINVQENRTGSLFTQNTHCKIVDNNQNHALTCFLYIHQNPMKAGLVKKMEDWPFSSFRDYCSLRNGTICKKEFACELLNLRSDSFYSLSHEVIPKDNLVNIF